MTILDTDHISILQHSDSPSAQALRARLHRSAERPVAISAITPEEQSRSWLGMIHSNPNALLQVKYYARFITSLRFFAKWRIVPFDDAAAVRYHELKASRIRISSSDLKIAAVCLVNDAMLLTRNIADFRQVPGLRFENWLS